MTSNWLQDSQSVYVRIKIQFRTPDSKPSAPATKRQTKQPVFGLQYTGKPKNITGGLLKAEKRTALDAQLIENSESG